MNKSSKRAQSIVGTNNDGGRPEHDFYPTPPEATRALLGKEAFGEYVWEPACGNGAMSKVIEERGHRVYSSDIEPRGYGDKLNFLESMTLNATDIITNPPFRLALEFAQHSLNLGARKVALLCKLCFLEGQTRADWLERSPLSKVLVFKKRIQFTRNGEESRGGGMIAFAWFVWERGYTGAPIIRWI